MSLLRGHGSEESGQLMFGCNIRYSNAVTIKDAYPIPHIDESLSRLGDAKFFTILDSGSLFWQVPLRKQDREPTAFTYELGLFQWKKNAFRNMQRHSYNSTVDGPGTPEGNKELWKPLNELP